MKNNVSNKNSKKNSEKNSNEISNIKNIDSKLAKQLQRLNIFNDNDLLLHLPNRYEDETIIYSIKQALQIDNSVSLNLTVLNNEQSSKYLLVNCKDDNGDFIQIRFMHFHPFWLKMLVANAKIRIFGKVKQGFNYAETIHPKFEILNSYNAAPKTTLTPIYPSTAGLSQYTLQNLISSLIFKIENGKNTAEFEYLYKDSLPEEILKKIHLPTFFRSIKFLHAPNKDCNKTALYKGDHPALMRIKFDEILAQQLSLRKAILNRKKKHSPSLKISFDNNSIIAKLLNNLPFELTKEQQKVAKEISNDLNKKFPMHRLLQGDVGSGKTIVAALAAAQCIQADFQVAIMAPTEVLAEQHVQKFSQWFADFGVEIAFLIGNQKSKEKKLFLQKIADGSAKIIIGTHALIQDSVNYHKLGLVIIDEQHRFGVAQRLNLQQKICQNDLVPHQLMMSATPIPRSLAMTLYADLDISTMNELPPGRTPIKTLLINNQRRHEIIQHIHKNILQKNQQVYWVCPLVEESEKLELQDAINTQKELQILLPDFNVELSHGKQKSAEKLAIMQRFIENQIQILVATTVIEVGVDVPNATVMVIEHAERFGLAQLHQLRGRVGRGKQASECILIFYPPLSELAKKRLQTIYENNDGFFIAQQDLKLRGPGEFVGSKQSGVILLRYANLEEDFQLVEQAQEVATMLLDETKYPEQIADFHIQRWLGNKINLAEN